MADLIELDIVVKDKGLKQSVTTVERLERQIIRAAKAIDQNAISQERYNKILLSAKRDYQTLGMSSQKATYEVRKFAEAQLKAASEAVKTSTAIKKQTEAMDTFSNTSRKGMRRMEVIAQQAGYQIGDFAVQIQGGTNAAVAFGQQASQLLGFFGPAGAIAGAALAITTGLIAPFMRGEKTAKELTDRIKELRKEIADIKGVQLLPPEQVALLNQQEATQLEINKLQDSLAQKKEFVTKLEQEQLTNGALYQGALSEVINTQDKINKLEEKRAETSNLLIDYSSTLVDKNLALYDVEKRTLEQGVELSQKKLQFGEDSVQVRELENQQLVENYQEDLRRLGLHKTMIDALVEMKKEALNNTNQLEDATNSAKDLDAALKSAASAMAQLSNFSSGLDIKIAEAAAKVEALKTGQDAANASMIAGLQAQAIQQRDTALAAAVNSDQLKDINTLYDESIGKIDKLKGLTDTAKSIEEANRAAAKATKGLSKEQKDLLKEAEALRKELEGPMVSAINGVSNAFGDFISNGLKDFKGFTKSILNSFKGMISQMISTAMSNKIMLSVGMGGSGLATQAAAGQLAGVGKAGFGGPMGNLMGTFGGGGAAGTGLLGGLGTAATGLGTGFMSSVYGGIGGMTGAVSGGLSMGGLAGISTAIGAIAAPLLAVAAVFSFFKKKTKELDSGLRITVTNMDALVNTFKTVQTKKYWGLSKTNSTTESAASSDIADPIVKAVQDMQVQMIKAADMFGVSSDAFDNFAYNFELSLKGLTDEQKAQKINEELTKMGDSFASLTGHFQTMNELLEAANQRMGLQNRLDQLLGNNAAILARQREAELAALHELNRPMAQLIYNLEDAQAALTQADQVVQQAFTSLSTSIEAEKNRLRDAFTSIVDGLKERLDAANASMSRSNSIYSMLEGAVSGRSVTSGLSQAFSRREGAMGFIRGGNFSDEKKLEQALNVVSEPTENLFGSFVEYARDFALTSRSLEEAKNVAQVQLTADEKSVLLLEDQITQAQTNLDAQLEALDKQYQTEVDQYNALLGIDTSVKSVNEAIGTLRGAIQGLMSAKAAAASAADMASGATMAGGLSQFDTGSKYKGFDLLDVGGASGLLKAASLAGIQTSGKTGLEIAQDIANKTGKALQLDSASRVQQFAMGGYHNGGMRLVGERGPELEATGPSRIFSHTQTGNMFRDPDLKDAVRSLKDEVSGLRSEQRQIQMDISKYTKRSYDIERKWDVEGLPATRV